MVGSSGRRLWGGQNGIQDRKPRLQKECAGVCIECVGV